MIHRHDAKRQAARKPIDRRPDESGYLAKNDAALRRERIAKLVDAIQRTAPPWSRMTPWDAERILERGQQQRELFAEGGAE